ncbi:CRISPR-associated ring nuclease Csm6 [Halomonas sp. LS-001]
MTVNTTSTSSQELTLLAVTGMSPQVVTETLYGLHEQSNVWPSRIEIITTQKGKQKVAEGLFDDGYLAALCDELGMPAYTREQVVIRVVPNAQGEPVDDARTEADAEALGDYIMQTVRDLTVDGSAPLHASIAGGRKTMTFYLGYAMSLFGRLSDSMSHVLVSEGYEGLPDFYYPTRVSRMIKTFSGQTLDTANAEVSLADIPFIRQRKQLPEMLRHNDSTMSFRGLVELINLGEEPERLAIRLDAVTRQVEIYSGDKQLQTVAMGGLFDWCWYEVVVQATRENDASLRRFAPDGDENGSYLGHRVMEKLAEHLALPYDAERDLRPQVDEWINHHEQTLEQAGIRPGDFGSNMRFGLDVSQITTRLNKRLKNRLPTEIAKMVVAAMVFDHQGQKTSGSNNKRGGYGLSIAPERIRVG